MQRSQLIIMVTIMTMAIILATGSFLAYNYLQGRYAQTVAEPRSVTVEDTAVTLRGDPDLGIVILPDGTVTDGQDVAGAQPETATAVPAPTDTPAESAPTAVPPTATIPPAPTAAPDPIIFISYTVQSGDSLYGLTLKQATSIALMAHHDVDDADLVPNTVIRLPVGNPAYCPGGRPYAVGEGDTAFNLARRFNTTPDEIKTRNGLNDDYVIKVAEIICLP